MIINDYNNYIKKYLKRSMMIIITLKIFKKIDDDNYIENIQRHRWEYLDQKYSKGSVGMPRSKIFKGIGGNT